MASEREGDRETARERRRTRGEVISAGQANPSQDAGQPRTNSLSGSFKRTLRKLRAVSAGNFAVRTWKGVLEDRLFGHAAELGFYFLFALFPTLFCAGSILGLAARSAGQIYDRLLDYLALVIPTSALGAVLQTFNETAAAASSGKVTFGTIGAIWSASVGVSAIQDTLNIVFKLEETRSYFVARVYAISLTLLLMVIWSLTLACMLGGDLMAAWSYRHVHGSLVAAVVANAARLLCWIVATGLLDISFAVVYSWAPDWKERHWHWLTPGTGIGILGWLLSSLGFRIYLHYFNTYTITYGSLGAVVILLMWFYISGLMLLLGAEIDSELRATVNQPESPIRSDSI
ncbi:MAG TPA: YihY/virulence factor BrkB family protein [Terracidiphilus sp.]|nr:YihY/virulence factor BrkB family protein [Terracidiphilus sp.]